MSLTIPSCDSSFDITLEKFLNNNKYNSYNFEIEISTFGSLSGAGKWSGGVLAPNGKIYGIPFHSTEVLEIDPETKTATTFGSVGSDTSK